jgi:hypothetical protein
MSDQLSPEERYDLATKLIVQSPPGQVNDVIAGESPRVLLATSPLVGLLRLTRLKLMMALI